MNGEDELGNSTVAIGFAEEMDFAAMVMNCLE